MTMPVTCPRCFTAATPSAEFCPRCGLPIGAAAATEPMDLAVEGRSYRVLDRIAVGSRSTVYRCLFGGNQWTGECIFKVSRDPVSNAALAREAEALRHLHAADPGGDFTPFLPAVLESFGYVGDRREPPRHANILRFHDEVRSPADQFYTLAEVRAAHPAGLDARDMAWIWRRLLTVLGFARAHDVAHGAVLPVHVLIEPAGHRLVLVDWCAATVPGRPMMPAPPGVPGAYRMWVETDRYATPAADLRLGARCMMELVADVPPAVARHLSRAGHGPTANAWQLRAEFDDLIETLWGPRQFRPLSMPARSRAI